MERLSSITFGFFGPQHAIILLVDEANELEMGLINEDDLMHVITDNFHVYQGPNRQTHDVVDDRRAWVGALIERKAQGLKTQFCMQKTV